MSERIVLDTGFIYNEVDYNNVANWCVTHLQPKACKVFQSKFCPGIDIPNGASIPLVAVSASESNLYLDFLKAHFSKSAFKVIPLEGTAVFISCVGNNLTCARVYSRLSLV